MAEAGVYLGEARWYAETDSAAARALIRAATRAAREIDASRDVARAVRTANELYGT